MNRTLWIAAILVAGFAGLLLVPAATAQSSPINISIHHQDKPEALQSGETQSQDLKVVIHYPPLSACLEYDRVYLDAKARPQLDVHLNPVAFRPDPGVAATGATSTHNATLTVSLNEPVPAYELMIVTVRAQGGGCTTPGGPYGDSDALTLAFLSPYQPDLEVTTVSVEPSPYGLIVWNVRFTNHANAATAVSLTGEGDVEYRNLPEQLVVPAPTVSDPAPFVLAEILVDNPSAEPQKAVLRYEHGPGDRAPGDAAGPWTGEIAAVIPANAEPAAESSDVEAAELPGFEVIPLALALTAAVLLRRRHR